MLHGRACFPRRSHLRLDDQHAAQSPCLAILVPLGMWRLIGNKRHRGSGGWPHPLPAFYRPRSRSDAPVTSRYTRSVAIHPIRRGAMPTDRVHRLPQQAQPRAIPPHRPQPAASNAATRPRHAHPGSEREALHQLGSVTPPPSWCNTPLSGVTPLSNKYRCGDMPRLSSQNTRQRSSAATEETVHHRETHAGNETTNSSTHQLLGHSNTRTTCACQRLRSLCWDNRLFAFEGVGVVGGVGRVVVV